MTIKEKILAFLDWKGVKKTEVFESIGSAPSNFKGAAKQTELGGNKIVRILTAFSDLSAEWLLRDEGDMLRTPSESSHSKCQNIVPTEPLTAQSIEPLVDKFLNTIQNQSEEIGRLKARIEELERERPVPTVPQYVPSTSKETVEP